MSSEALIVRDGWLRRILPLLGASFRAQAVLFIVPVLYLISNAVLFSQIGSHGTAPVTALVVSLFTFSLPVGLIVLLLLRFVQYGLIVKPVSPVRQFAADISGLFVRPSRIVNALPVLVAMVIFNKSMVELKPAIPAIVPFSWDMWFMELDRRLHFGVDPWVLLQPLMGYDWVTYLTNIAYNFWFVALFGAWYWFGFHNQSSELRLRFFLSYMLIWWIGGGLLAVYFSSAGPVYFDELGLAPNPYEGLFAYHADVNTRHELWFLKTQKMLWDGYMGNGPALGISAFPSMHNGTAVLFALAFRKVSRPMGWLFTAYAAIILLGSVHLGWHYAVDGYAAIALAALCWWIAGYVARRVAANPVHERFNQGLASL